MMALVLLLKMTITTLGSLNANAVERLKSINFKVSTKLTEIVNIIACPFESSLLLSIALKQFKGLKAIMILYNHTFINDS